MISEKELLREIEEYEIKQPTYQVCEKLATLYIIYRNTDTPEERKILNTLISEINVGNIYIIALIVIW